MAFHPDPSTSERDSLERETKALLLSGVPGECDPPPRANHPMPWKTGPPLKGPDGEPGRPGESRGRRHLSV